jgi:inosine-uridine nucleoside N-ribohydrolase
MGGSLNPQQRLPGPAATQFAREFANSPRREFNIRFDPEAASITFRAPWKKIVMIPIDPSTATELSPGLIKRLSSVDTPVARTIQHQEPNFPLWDEIASAVWLDPSLVTESEPLYVDVDTVFGPEYGNTLSWSPGYQPDLGEQLQTAVRSVDVPRMEALMVRILTSPQATAQGRPVP